MFTTIEVYTESLSPCLLLCHSYIPACCHHNTEMRDTAGGTGRHYSTHANTERERERERDRERERELVKQERERLGEKLREIERE